MSTIKKRKIKIKKKNFTIFLLIILIIVFIISKTTTTLYKTINTKKDTKIKEEIPTEEQDEFSKIKNKIDYYNDKYLSRYKAYQKKNPNLEIEQIIKNVNMNLDKIQYQDIIPAKNLNTEYILVNKYYYLTKDYIPDNLETINNQYALSGMKLVNVAKNAFEEMSKNAAKENLKIIAMSSYRSYDYQVNLWNKYAKQDGEEKADTYSGRAGHSEHQTGLAVDVYNQKENYTNFENTKEFEWMQKHAHEYGFILRFPKGKEQETGYQYESWHYRYVGVEIANYIQEKNITLEEYYATKIKDW